MQDTNLLVRHLGRVRRDLGHDGLQSLADRGRTKIHRQRAVRLQDQARLFLWSRGAALDEAPDREPMIITVDQPAAELFLSLPIELSKAPIEHRVVVATVKLG